MLKAHIDAIEAALQAQSHIPDNSGHPLHKGNPRERFVREFLEGHLSEKVAVGTGEIIDANSSPGEARNQIDIVIYKRDYPRLDFGGVHGFLAESVVATIEVKSVLDQAAVRQATSTTKRLKGLTRNLSRPMLTAGYQPPSILSYVVAYAGPARMDTVWKWISSAATNEDVTYPRLPTAYTDRVGLQCPGLDAVIVLGKGFVHFGNAPYGFFTMDALDNNPDLKWAVCSTERGSLLLLFLMLTAAVSGTSISVLNPLPYLSSFKVESARLYP